MTVVELVKVIDNPKLAEPESQIVTVVCESDYYNHDKNHSYSYWYGTINEILTKYNNGLLQGLGNAEVVKLTTTYDYDLEETIPQIISTDF